MLSVADIVYKPPKVDHVESGRCRKFCAPLVKTIVEEIRTFFIAT